MKKYLFLLTIIGLSSFAHANSGLPDNRHVAVTGHAEISAKPDIAIVHLQVVGKQKTSLQAKQEVDDKVNKLLKGLAKFNVDKENVSASSISTQPHYTYPRNQERQLSGYQAIRTLKVSLTDLNKLNQLMDFALSVEINEIRNIELKSSQADTLKQQAYILAVKNAKQQASALASAFDSTLGGVYSINVVAEHSHYRFGQNKAVERIQFQSSDAAPGQYLEQNINFSASVNAVFDLTL
ncbi:SIMPL domain-containing protein [Psychrobium sp. 1_MG-2023]|uniref:SIMPL domain-containing protein n=1 Tax=Psychrobium sp. 1_MG-2023 TaxID=3062624 RepID=UPI000C341292|nr:SIMPL domain-containing protein [Psychrobium sp. 1_MG-2023]MDP2561653.1 SIMPL domain-containing protein [Psychrobium sp. 1_MG-2023]PKF55669.1 SIMPL domain-containing protein [Alteromonadales bacterium alter-6D02]